MLKEGVRLDRVRGGRQKYRRNPDSPYQIQVVSAQRPSLALEGTIIPHKQFCLIVVDFVEKYQEQNKN